jgi:transcriptional regulator with XRE-family HTH domain
MMLQICHVYCITNNAHEDPVSKSKQETYGELTRRVREEKEYGLREFAKMIGVSATYLSQVERGELPPPAEGRVVRIAELLELDKDELLALAGRVASDLEDIILKKPRGTADLLRHVQKMTAKELAELNKSLTKGKK